MENKQPLTIEENEIMTLLIAAHDKYYLLENQIGRGSDKQQQAEWIAALHTLQRIILLRSMTRDYPAYYTYQHTSI